MSIPAFFITLIFSLALGFFAYPALFGPSAQQSVSYVETIKVNGPSGQMTFDIDIREISPEELPAKVKVKKSFKIFNELGQVLELQPGATVTLESFSDIYLKIKDSSGNFSGETKYKNTDLLEVVAKRRFDEMMGNKLDEPETEEEPVVEEAPMVEEVVLEDTGPLTEVLPDSDLLAVVKGSVKNKDISEFTSEAVTEWTIGENETIFEKEYQVGLVTFQKKTFLGDQPVSAKALVRNGKLEKWVYVETGVEID